MTKNVLFQETQYQVIDLGSTKVILSILDSLSMGEGTDLGFDFSKFEVIVYAEDIILSEEVKVKSLFISAFNITTNPITPEMKMPLTDRNVAFLKTTEDLDLKNKTIVRLFDYNNKKNVTVTATSIAPSVLRTEEQIQLGAENIDLASFMFVHPVQCSMLLQKAQSLYREADPITNKTALDQAIILLNRLKDRTKIFYDLAADAPLAKLYIANEKTIGALNSLDTLKNIYNTANDLIGQIAKGNDYYGNSYHFVPLASFSFYQGILENQLKSFGILEGRFLEFFNTEKAEEERLEDLRQARQSLDTVINNADEQIKDLKARISNTEAEITALQAQFKDKQTKITDKLEEFKEALKKETDLYVDVQSLFSSLTTLAFLAESPAGWVLVASQIAYNISQNVDSVQDDEGITINKDYLINKLQVFEGDITSGTLSEEIRKLDDGTMDMQDPGANKLIVEESSLESFLSKFYKRFPDETKELQQAFEDYVNLVLARNDKVLYYNAMVTIVIQNHNIIKDARSKEETLNDQNLKIYQPSLPAFTTLMTSLYLNAQSQVMTSLYLTERALQFWGLTDLKPVSNTFSGKQVVDINQAVLEEAKIQILSTYAKTVESYGGNAQSFPAKHKSQGVIWNLKQSDVDSLKVLKKISNEYSLLFSVPAATLTTKIADNPFASYANVRLSIVRAWLEGVSTADNWLTLSLTHTGSEVIVNSNDEEFKFNHNAKKVKFKYNLNSKEIFEDGIIGYVDKDENYALVGPFTWWQLSIRTADNVDLDLSQLTKVSIEFHGTNYSF